MYKEVKEQQQAYELMKKVFADLDITYEENVPDDQIGFYTVKDGVEKRLPDDFLKGYFSSSLECVKLYKITDSFLY